jgi:hypothetical protein
VHKVHKVQLGFREIKEL